MIDWFIHVTEWSSVVLGVTGLIIGFISGAGLALWWVEQEDPTGTWAP